MTLDDSADTKIFKGFEETFFLRVPRIGPDASLLPYGQGLFEDCTFILD